MINLKKLRFTKQESNFVDYNTGWVSFRPSDEMLSAINDSSMSPNRTISDI